MFDESSTPPSPLNATSLALALGVHLALFLLFWGFSLVIRSHREVVIPIDMTVVVHENLDKPEDDLPPSDKPEEKEPEPEPEPPKPEPPKPAPPPPTPKVEQKQDAVVVEKKKPEKKPVKRREFVRGKRITRKTEKQPDFTKSRHIVRRTTGNGPRTEKRMSDAEIRKWLALGARPGTRNQLPTDELSRCLSLIKIRFDEAWDQPPWAPGLKPVILEIRFGSGGRILGYQVVDSSGDRSVDETVLRAAARVGSVPGLTAEFLSQYATCRIGFEIKPQ